LELSKAHIRFQTQYALNWFGQSISIEGKSYNNPQNNFKDVLTVVDFFIEKRGVKLCVYTDGHSYHERTEDQATRDRNIDRKLQELGFQVLRYTGKEVNENIGKILTDIQKWID
jgi:very-short-patch-repair endonuclease